MHVFAEFAHVDRTTACEEFSRIGTTGRPRHSEAPQSSSLYGRHPWVLAGAVDRVEPITLAGEHLIDCDNRVDLHNEKHKFIARGTYNAKSRIRVRLFTWKESEFLDADFFRRRLQAAIATRRQLGYEPTTEQIAAGASRSETATRLVFSEADNLSGLVIDRYGDYLVLTHFAGDDTAG